jgi:hypothetical protein
MRTLMVYSFYLCTVFFLVYECLRLGGLNFAAILDDLTKKAKLEQEENERNKNSTISPPDAKIADQITFTLVGMFVVVLTIVYMVWTLLGLFTSQWIFFVALLVLSLVVALVQKVVGKSTLVSRLDAFITIVLLVFMLINRMHIHMI